MSNPITNELCSKCYTRLMITVVPRAAIEEIIPGGAVEEHLLERISALEYTLARMQERFDRLLEMFHRQSAGSFYDHAMLDSLISLLCEENLVNKDKLIATWQIRLAEKDEQNHFREKIDSYRQRILTTKKVVDEKFVTFVSEGLGLLLSSNDNSQQAIRLLEKAILLDPENVELNFFLGEYFFCKEKLILAQHYLEHTLKYDTRHYLALLMLGVLSGDNGNFDQAKNYLLKALKIKKDSFLAHYALGRILASENQLDEALPHFKQALLLEPTAEMYFVMGHAYMIKGQVDLALKHLRKAVDLDPEFDAALYNLGLIYLKSNLLDKAREHFRAAYEINPIARYRNAMRARSGVQLPILPVFGHAKVAPRKIVTSSDERFAQLLRRVLKNLTLEK
ncbi:MAG: tetratricopeptide repeat protein [Acidobacteria bacterium]|nr:tetratricopeptide repeat protein [Acidobacteriota bacterium]